MQGTVEMAKRDIHTKLEPTHKEGDPTGETLFNFHPRSYLVVGSMNEFKTNNGINESKFRSFELFRRNIQNPEIITFDELLGCGLI